MSPFFKVAAAQVPSVRGDIERNIATHAVAIEAAAKNGVSVLIFPELSLTGYEPNLAAESAMTPADSRLASLIALAKKHRIEVVLGAPLTSGVAKPTIGAILITSSGTTKTYRKMHLGASERSHFVPGDAPLTIAVAGHTVGIAICADSSQASHPQAYADAGADIYAAGVFLNAEWYATDVSRLALYAARHRMLVVMANHAASIGTYSSVGKSTVWAPDGRLLVQATGAENALLIAIEQNKSWRAETIGV